MPIYKLFGECFYKKLMPYATTVFYHENDFLDSLRLIEKRKINFKPIISLEENLENGERVFNQLKNNKDGKMIKIILTN